MLTPFAYFASTRKSPWTSQRPPVANSASASSSTFSNTMSVAPTATDPQTTAHGVKIVASRSADTFACIADPELT